MQYLCLFSLLFPVYFLFEGGWKSFILHTCNIADNTLQYTKVYRVQVRDIKCPLQLLQIVVHVAHIILQMSQNCSRKVNTCSISCSLIITESLIKRQIKRQTNFLACHPLYGTFGQYQMIYAPLPEEPELRIDVIAPHLSGHRRRPVQTSINRAQLHLITCKLWNK